MSEKSPGTFSAENVTLRNLIQEAYGGSWSQRRTAPTQGPHIFGGPAWLDSDRFDIIAKWKSSSESEAPAAHPTQSPMRLFLQTLLADRFHLKIHQETRNLPVYFLVVAKNGPKLRRGTCIAPDSKALASADRVAEVYCGTSRMGQKGQDWTLDGSSITVKDVVGTLSLLIGSRPVLDRTGIVENFDTHLQWTPLLGESGDSGQLISSETTSSSIFAVLREQLGLELKPGKSSVEVLVIDDAQTPSEN